MNTHPAKPLQSRWQTSLIYQRGKFILAIPVSCLVASLATVGWLQFKTANAQYQVQHTQKVRLEAGQLLTALLDAETEVRGYDIIRRQEFFVRYESAIAEIPVSLANLEALVADNPVQTQRIRQIRALAQSRVSFLQRNLRLIDALPDNASNPPQLIAQLLEGKQIMEQTREQIEQFLAEEERLQTKRNAQLRQQRQLTWMVLIGLAGIGSVGSLLAAYLLNRLAGKLMERDRHLRESEVRYRLLLENFPNGAVLLFDTELRYIIADGQGLADVGLSRAQLEGKTIWELLPPETCSAIEPIYRRAIAGEVTTAELPYANKLYLVHVLPVRNDRGEVFAGMVMAQDMTERKQGEAQLGRVNRSLRTLSECNQALVRATDEPTLLQDICRIVVEFGSYRAAWIGFAQQDELKSVRPVAQVGYEEGYLETLDIRWSDTERGRGPTGTSIRTGQTCFAHDILNDPHYIPWRDAAIERGYASCISLPLIVEGATLGALNIYAAESHAFDSAEVKLLTELANDLAYGIAALRTQSAHQQTEAALRESNQRLDSILGSLKDVVWSVSATTYEVLYLNPATEYVYRRPVQDFLDNPSLWIEIVHPDDAEQVRAFNPSLLERGSLELEYRILRPDGEVRWLYDRGRVIYAQDGSPIRLDGMATDITARKQAEVALRDSEERFRAMFEKSHAVKLIIEPESGVIVDANQAAVKFYGYSHSELITKTIFDLNTLSVEETKAQMSRAQLEECNYFLFRHQLASGEIRDVEVYASPVEIQGRLLLFSIIHDSSDRKQAEEALRDSEAKFRAFLESASEAIIITNSNSEIVVFNTKAQELFGYEPTEVLGRTVEFLMPERFQHRHIEHRATYKEHPTRRSMSKTRNLYARRKNGSEFPIEAGLSPVQTKDGVFILTFLTDITERRQAEEEIQRLNESLKRRAMELETRYQQIVELAEEGIWVLDSELKTTYTNHAMQRMLGYTEEEMLGRSIFDFMDVSERQSAITTTERRKQGVAEKHEFKLTTKDGRVVWTYMSTSPVLDESGRLLWSCALVYDITERKQAEEQLRQSSERISLANAELARATRLKDEFLASMSHELRTPLNAILGLSEALQEEVYGSLTERQRKSLITIETSGQHLLELINDILDLSKIESGKLDLQLAPVSLPSLCESSLTFIKQQAHQKTIKLNYKITEGVQEVEVDERRLRQVLVNLLSNAVKFTPEGGEIWLDVEADSEGEVLKFSIIDTGIGIARENLDKLFKPFVQLDSSLSRRYAGTGLGLALVRRIAELHGGSVSLESELGKGSCFTVTLPWREANQVKQGAQEKEQAIAPLLHIHQALVIEDSDPAAKQIARYLTELGAAVVINPQGEGTLETVLRFDPDVIILDLLLPHLSGWEVLTQLKANPTTQNIPVLVISVVDERSRALALGASEYLLKPISRQQFQLTLSKILSETSQQNSNTALVVSPEKEQHLPLILVAEDNEANITTLMDYLENQGFRVSLARNGLEAVQLAKQQTPDLILMDIQMPEMDGLEATRLIHQDSELKTIPIIALTALAMPGDRERCLAAGAKDYLTKPVGLKKLVNVISQYITTTNS